jgi:formate hydrogenlyase regulatory protein HycA
MAVPRKIKISREEDYYTHYIGKTGDGRQFMALIGATLPVPLPNDWPNHKKWYAILHTFDKEGKHIETKAICTGKTADGEDEVVDKARTVRNDMVSSLGEISFEDVEAELFSTEVDGFIFGLVDASEPAEGIERIDLLPNDLAFFEPWDGEYDT